VDAETIRVAIKALKIVVHDKDQLIPTAGGLWEVVR